jgi:hypothetical protein
MASDTWSHSLSGGWDTDTRETTENMSHVTKSRKFWVEFRSRKSEERRTGVTLVDGLGGEEELSLRVKQSGVLGSHD